MEAPQPRAKRLSDGGGLWTSRARHERAERRKAREGVRGGEGLRGRRALRPGKPCAALVECVCVCLPACNTECNKKCNKLAAADMWERRASREGRRGGRAVMWSCVKRSDSIASFINRIAPTSRLCSLMRASPVRAPPLSLGSYSLGWSLGARHGRLFGDVTGHYIWHGLNVRTNAPTLLRPALPTPP